MSASGKFFRPSSGSGGGTLFDSSDEESSDEGENKRNASSSEQESSSEEEESDNDQDVVDNKKRKKKNESTAAESKKPKRASFFDEEAEDAASDGEEEVYGDYNDPNDRILKHYTEEDIQRENMDEEAQAIMAQQDKRRKNASFFNADMSGHEVAEMVKHRYDMARKVVDRRALDEIEDRGAGGGAYNAVSQQSLVPSVSDPSLWMFACAPGKEKEVVYQIMNKCIARVRQGKPLGITAAVAGQSRGKIFIESYSEPAVIEAIQGFRKVYPNSRKLVPISDMTTVMAVISKSKPVKRNDWVRMTRGHYKGDLALVKSVKDSGVKCVIQAVPRLDLTLGDLPPEEARARRKTVRPAQKFFNASEIAALGKDLYRQRFPGGGEMCDYFEGNYYHDGYLLKEVNVGTMVKPCGVEEPPTLDELQRFRRRSKKTENSDSRYDDGGNEENEGSRIAASLLDELSELQGETGLDKTDQNVSACFVIGDTVEVIEGDLVGMRGKLISIDGSTIKMKPSNAAELADTTEVEFLASQVRKYIPVGSHVKVIDGRYVNETGVVVAVEKVDTEVLDYTAVVLTDMTHKEISVRISQLQESAEVASGLDKLAGYELHDLVVLSGGGSSNEVGVIVRVGREEFSIINNHGIVREVRPEELRGKRNSASIKAVALDVQGNQIRCGDTVSVAEGPHKGKTATIKRMSRAQLFLYSQIKTENSGIFVVRSRSCVLTGNSASQKHKSAPSANPYGAVSSGRGGPKNVKDDNLLRKSVRIQSGQWKGYLGVVTDATTTHVQVELHSRLKKVTVTRERVVVGGDKFGATDDFGQSSNPTAAPTTPFLGGATPMHGGATPMHGSATPMHDGIGGGFTPSHSGSGSSDVWRPGGDGSSSQIDVDTTNENSDMEPTGSTWGSTPVAATRTDGLFDGSTTAASVGGGWGSSDQGGSNTWAPTSDNGTSSNTALQDSSNNTTDLPSINNDVMGNEDSAAPKWFLDRVCVLVQKNGESVSGIIKEVNSSNKTATIEFEDSTSAVVTPLKDLTLFKPKEHDTVLVTDGPDVGVEGELMCIDGADAILKDANEDFKIVDFCHLAKIESET